MTSLWWGPTVSTDKSGGPTDTAGQQGMATVTGPLLNPCGVKNPGCDGVNVGPESDSPTRGVTAPQKPEVLG